MAKIKSRQTVGVTLEEHERSLKLIDGTNEPVLALHRIYPTGHRTPPHNHSRVQIWCARRGGAGQHGGWALDDTAGSRAAHSRRSAT